MTNRKKYAVIFLLAFSCLCYNLPYLSSTFYQQFLEAFQLSNAEAGMLLSMFSLTATPGYLFGGMLADKFSPKKLIILSQVLTAAFGISITFLQSYPLLMACYLGFGLSTTFIHWSAMMKLIRAQAGENEEGKAFGFFEFSYAIVGAFASYGVLAAMDIIINMGGFRIVTSVYGIVLLVIAVLIAILLKDADKNIPSGDFNVKMVGKALAHPVTWLNGFIVMGLFILVTGTSYLNPYLTGVFGASVTLGTSITIANRTILRMVFSPLGGLFIDRLKTPKFLIVTSAVMIALCLASISVPGTGNYMTPALILVLVLISVLALSRSGMYTPIPEAGIPLEITGTAMGICSAIGYSTDLWLYTLCGSWLDKFGNDGYRYIFMLFIAGLALVIISSVLLGIYEKKHTAPISE